TAGQWLERGPQRGRAEGIELAADRDEAAVGGIEGKATHLDVVPLLVSHALGIGRVPDMDAVVSEAADAHLAGLLEQGRLDEGVAAIGQRGRGARDDRQV